jgi:hypothetical protein
LNYLVRVHPSDYTMYSRMKSRHGFVSAVSASLSVLLICSALAMAAAKESQAPLNVDVDNHVVSKLRWEGCGAVSNHTLECKRLNYRGISSSNGPVDVEKAPGLKSRWTTSIIHLTRRSQSLLSDC